MTAQASPDGRPDAPDPDLPPAALNYPLGEPPGPGAVREVVPGVLWLRMPLPFALNHINLWAIADRDERGAGWAIVDTGTKTPEALAAWRTLIAPDGPLATTPQGARITRIFCTHMHPDHVGLSGWLTRKFQCRLWMTRLEYLTCRTLNADTGREAPEDAIRFYRQCGWPEEALDIYRARFGGFGRFLHALPDSYRRIREGEQIRIGDHDWRVLVGNGHSPEHACLLSPDQKLLISGDQVLPRISSNVSVHPTEPDADPLGDWLASLSRLRRDLPGDLLVLPAHGEPFTGLHARLERLLQGHMTGLLRLRRSLRDGPKRAIDVFGALFARRIDGQGELLGMATGESLAHLNHLLSLGDAGSEIDDQGVRWYRLSAAAQAAAEAARAEAEPSAG